VDRIEIVYRFGLPLEAVEGKIPGHGEEVMDTKSVQCIQDRFYLVSIFIFTCKMDDGIDPHAANLKTHDIRGQGRVTAWIISDGEGMNEASPGKILRKTQHFVLIFPARPPSGD
jgi:hypothetical protein